jgi:hypothetical protein
MRASIGLAVVWMGTGMAPALADNAAVQQYIVAGEKAWTDSVVSGDASAARRLLAADYVGVNGDGSLSSKAKELSDIVSEAPQYASDRIDYVHVRFFGDTAVAQGSESWAKKDGKRGRWVWTDVWVKRGGEWQIVSSEDADAPVLAR